MIKMERWDFPVRIGRSLKEKFTVKDRTTGQGADLTGWGVKSQIRSDQDAGSSLIADFVVDVSELNVGVFYLTLTELTIDAITAKEGEYDVVLTNPAGFDEPYFYGTIPFEKGATARPV